MDKFDIEEIIKHKNERLLKKWIILLLDSLTKGDEDKNELAYFPDYLVTVPLEFGWQEPYQVHDKDLDEALNVIANFEGDSQQEAIQKSKTLLSKLRKTAILYETDALIPQKVRKKHGFDIRTILNCNDEKKLCRLTLYLLESFIKNDIDHKAFSRYPEDLVIIPILVFQKNSFKVQDKNLRNILNEIGNFEYLDQDKALKIAHQILKTIKKIIKKHEGLSLKEYSRMHTKKINKDNFAEVLWDAVAEKDEKIMKQSILYAMKLFLKDQISKVDLGIYNGFGLSIPNELKWKTDFKFSDINLNHVMEELADIKVVSDQEAKQKIKELVQLLKGKAGTDKNEFQDNLKKNKIGFTKEELPIVIEKIMRNRVGFTRDELVKLLPEGVTVQDVLDTGKVQKIEAEDFEFFIGDFKDYIYNFVNDYYRKDMRDFVKAVVLHEALIDYAKKHVSIEFPIVTHCNICGLQLPLSDACLPPCLGTFFNNPEQATCEYCRFLLDMFKKNLFRIYGQDIGSFRREMLHRQERKKISKD